MAGPLPAPHPYKRPNSATAQPAPPARYIVAATAFTRPFETLIEPLAEHLVEQDFDIRSRLAGTLPRLIRVTEEKSAALNTVSFLRQHGATATACDARAVCTAQNAISLTQHPFTDHGILGYRADGSAVGLPFSEALCMLPAFHRGYRMYVFPHSGGRPWVLTEELPSHSVAPAPSLPPPSPSFQVSVRSFQRALPHAIYDERLLNAGFETPSALLHAKKTTLYSDAKQAPVSQDTDTFALDMLAHLIALAYSRGYF